MILRKGIEVKDVLASGIVLVKFSTMNIVDKDGDVTLPGFIGKQTVMMLPTHDWSSVPLGKGETYESADAVLADLKMNLDIPKAKDWHSALAFDLANPPAIQEYSYGFTTLSGGSSSGEFGDAKQKVRFLRPTPEGAAGCKVHEISPVLVGAGENTGTMSVKGAKFCDEIELSVKSIDDLISRAVSLADLRAQDGRSLSAVSRERLKHLTERLDAAIKALGGLTPDLDAAKAVRVEYLRALKAGIK